MRFVRMAAAAVAVLATVGGATAKDWSKVRIGTEGAYPPFNSLTADGQLVGFDIDIANALCEEMKVECEFVTQDWDGMIPALQAGKYDAIIASMSITEERLKTIDFSDKYYNTPTSIIGAKGDDFEATPEGLSGKILGVQVSTIHAAYADKYFAPTADDIKQYQTQDEANQDLAAGRVDAVQADAIALDAFLKSDAGACCEYKGNVADDPAILGAGVGVGLRKGEDELKEKINAAIAAIRTNGTYEEFSKKYFDFNIYGG